jgi:hypothetical protein
MRIILSSLLFFKMAAWGTTVITAVQVTQTQAVIKVTTDQAGSCAYRVSENSLFTPLVHDVDPALFTGYNLDSRAGSMIQGTQHVFVAGKRSSDLAADGRRYSRALQANTLHWVGVTCGTDSETVATFQTENPPLGRSVPEAPPFDPAAFGNYAWPDIDFTDQSKTYVDPMTGILLKRVTSSGWRGKTYQNNPFGFTFGNTSWTNPNNLIVWPGNASTLATATTDTIFVAADLSVISDYRFGALAISGWTPFDTVDDVLVRSFGYGTDATALNRTALVCLSNDSGNTCDTPELVVLLPQASTSAGAAAGSTAPASGFPQPSWTSWSSTLPYHGHEWGNVITSVTTSGNTITNTGTQSGQYFSRSWKPGGKVLVNDTEIYTIAALVNGTTITTVETMIAHSSPVDFKSLVSGIRLRKQTSTGTLSLAVGYDVAFGAEFIQPFDGARNQCSPVVETVTVDSMGNPAPARNAYLCLATQPTNSHEALFAFFPDIGETRLLANFESIAGYQYHAPDWAPFDGSVINTQGFGNGNAWDLTVGTRFYTSIQVGGHNALLEADYTGNFSAYNPGYFVSGWPADSLTYKIIGYPSAGLGIDQQVAALGNPLFIPAQWPNYQFLGIINGKAGWNITSLQDFPSWVALQDVSTGTVTSFIDNITTYPFRFWGNHGCKIFAGTFECVGNILGNKGVGSGVLFSGPFVVKPTMVNKGGVWSSDTSLTATYTDICPVGIAQQWQVLGAVSGMSRCVLMRATQPCSVNGGAFEIAHFPCAWDSTKSMMATLAPGDRFWLDVTCNGACNSGSAETMRVVTTPTSTGNPGEVEFWVLRFSELYANIGGAYGQGYSHANGWNATMIPPEARTNATAYIGSSGALFPEVYTVGATHADIGTGYTPGNSTTIMSGNTLLANPNGYGIRYDQPFAAQVDTPGNYNVIAGNFAGANNGGLATESYVSMRQLTAPPNEQRWFVDLLHINPSAGVGQESYSGVGTIAATLVSGTSGVLKFTTWPGDHTNPKTFPGFAYAGRYTLQDVSSPATGNVITDSTRWGFCIPYAANECRTGSAVGEAYVSVPQVDLRGITDSQCIAGWYATTSPCAWTRFTSQVWGIQVDASRNPVDDNTWRKLTMAFSGPGRQYQFGNIIPTPDGKWAFTQCYWCSGGRNELVAMKLPPFPNYDSRNRADFVPVPVEIPQGPGVAARVKFGYVENGPPSSFFCTSRQEACVTDMSVTPFAYVQSDTLAPTFCGSGCTINIPGISGRVVYYAVEWLDQTGTVTQKGPMQASIVP